MEVDVQAWMEGKAKVSTKIVQGPAVDKDSVQLNGLDSDDYDMELGSHTNFFQVQFRLCQIKVTQEATQLLLNHSCFQVV